MKAGNLPRIIFLTSTNLASNPRCRKEVELALEQGYEAVVFAFDMANWTRKEEEKIRKQWPEMEYYSLPTGKDPFLPWLITGLSEKAARWLVRLGLRSGRFSAIATSKRTITLLQALQKTKPSGKLIIAHNPGAFFPAYYFSRASGIPYAVDIEDYHPGENNAPLVKQSVLRLMHKILPGAAYVSFAAPLIREATLAAMQNKPADTVVINNVFAAKDFEGAFTGAGTDTKLKLVWFSQHIGFGRGLDELLPMLESFASQIQLTLIGNIDQEFREQVLKKYSFITISGTLSQELLNKELANHDIGLAIESNNADENRKICLTNKIWAYLQAGLYIWASNTPAQKQFAEQFPENTELIDLENRDMVIDTLNRSLNNRNFIRNARPARQSVNRRVSWEVEKNNLVKRWKAITGR